MGAVGEGVTGLTPGRAGKSSFVVRRVLVGATVVVDVGVDGSFCTLGGLVGGTGDSERAGTFGVVDVVVARVVLVDVVD